MPFLSGVWRVLSRKLIYTVPRFVALALMSRTLRQTFSSLSTNPLPLFLPLLIRTSHRPLCNVVPSHIVIPLFVAFRVSLLVVYLGTL